MSNQKKNVFDDVSTDDDFSSQDDDNNRGAGAALQPTQVKTVDSNAKGDAKRSQQREDDESSSEESSEDDAPKVDSPPTKQRESLPSNAPPTVRHMDPQEDDNDEEEEEDEDEEPAPKKAAAQPRKEEMVFVKTQPDPAEKVQQDINQKGMKVSTSVANTPQKDANAAPAPANRRQNVEPEEDSYYYYSSSKSGDDQDSAAAAGGAAGGRDYTDEDEEEENEHRMLLDYVLNEDDDSYDWTRYLFPRLDRSLMNYQFNQDNKAAQGKMTRKDPTQKDDVADEPPNAIELFVAYIIAGDMRLNTCAAFVLLAIIFTIAAIPLSQIDIPGRQCYTLFGYKENCDRSTYFANVNFIPCNGIKHRLQAGAAFIIISLAVELFTFISLLLMVFCSPIRRKKVHQQHNVIPLTQEESNHEAQVREQQGATFNNYYLYHREQQVETVASCRSRWIIGGISLSNIAFLLIPWAIVAGIVTSNTCVADPTTKAQYDSVITALNVTTEIEYNTAKYYSYGVGFGLLITAWALNTFGLFVLLVTPVALI